MPKLKKIVVIIFFTVSLNAQPRNFTSNPVAELINKMITNEAWDQIYHYSKKNLRKHKDFNSDIKKTIQFIKKQKCTTLIDSFFMDICLSAYSDFPFKQSGNSIKELYNKNNLNAAGFSTLLYHKTYKTLYPKIVEIISLDLSISIPILIQYLNNDAATRLCLGSDDWDELPFYLSISDVAIELIEIISLCDFFDNASFYDKLYSNLPSPEKNVINSNIIKWHNNTVEKIEK